MSYSILRMSSGYFDFFSLSPLYNWKMAHKNKKKKKKKKNSWLKSSRDSPEYRADNSLGSNSDEVKGRESTSATDSHHHNLSIHIQ